MFVTHDQEEALTMSDRIAVMSSGQILQIGSRAKSTTIRQTDLSPTSSARPISCRPSISVPKTAGRRSNSAPARRSERALPDEEVRPGAVSIVIRPEHARIAQDDSDAALSGLVEHVVYFGTDTHYHLRLAGGEEFIVRQQNTRDNVEDHAAGDQLGITVGSNAVQVLKD